MAQPINSIESQEGLSSLIGTYYSSVYYEGLENTWSEQIRRSVLYDNRDNMIEYSQDNFNNEKWDKGLKYTFEYDFDNNLLSSKGYYWMGEEWSLNSADIYTYNEHNQLADVTLAKKKMGVITNDRKIIFKYNENGEIINRSEQIWNFSEWVNTFRTLTDYDSHGKLAIVQNEVWDSDSWIPINKSEYVYDLGNRLCERIEYTFEENNWNNSRMVNCKYDKWGRMVETKYSFWSGIDWIPDYMVLYTYHKDDIVKSQKVLNWSVETLEYSEYSLTEKTFDHLDREVTKQVKLNKYGQLEDYCKSSYTYDKYSSLVEYEKQVYNDGIWSNDFKFQYDFSVMGIDEDIVSYDGTSVFPNPFDASSNISFSLDENAEVDLKIFDNKGEEVNVIEHGQLNAGQHTYVFNGEGLADGVYFYRLSINGKTIIKPVVKIR